MALSSVELWQRITASQLASPLICRAWAADTAAQLSPSDAIDGVKVAQQLVAQGKLTQFQADSLVEVADQKLVEHGYRLLEPVNYTPYPTPDVRAVFSGWWLAAKTATSPPAWYRWLTAEDLKQSFIAQANPSLPRVLQHAQVKHDNLQGVEAPEMASGALQLSLQPMQGKLLTAWCDGQPKPVEMVTQMILDVATSLSALHTAGLTHGRVTPDRICVGQNGQYQLLRDPLCTLPLQLSSTDAQRRQPQGLLAQKLPGNLMAAHFMAPEFLAPAQAATAQTDLYSLGCVAWIMLVGKPPYHADRAEKILAAHAERPMNQAALDGLPEPLARCLWHCLAKNPGSRFSTGRQLVESLQEAQRIVAAGPSGVVKSIPQKVVPSLPKPIASIVETEKTQPNVPTVKPPVKPAVKPPVESAGVEQPSTASERTKSDAPAPSSAPPVKIARPEPTTAQSPPAMVPAEVVVPAVTPPVPAKPAVAKPAIQPAIKPAIQPAAVKPVDVQPTTREPVSTSQQVVDEAAITPKADPTPSVPSQTVPEARVPVPDKPDVVQPAPAKPAARLAAPGKPPARRTAQRGVRKPKVKRKTSNAWLTPVIGGGALVALVLMLLVMRGGLGGSSSSGSSKKQNTSQNTSNNSAAGNSTSEPVAAPIDPLTEKFELVDSDPAALWAPPRVPEPIALDLLPPGAQAFVALRPSTLMSSANNKQLLSLLDSDVGDFWKWLAQLSGAPLESLDRVVVAAYPGQNGVPQYALRVELAQPTPLSKLKGPWNLTAELKVGQQMLLISNTQAYYIAQQPLVDSQSIATFAVGPTELMRDSASLNGASGPLGSAVEQLWQNSDRNAEFNLLLSPPFLFTEGRSWLESAPPRVKSLVETWLPRESRGLLFTSSLGERWFYELRLAGANDRDAVVSQQKLSDLKDKLPQQVESWLVNELAHPHWRAIANRYPSMLRALTAQTRVATENGQAIANAYLPISAAPNVIYASWMAMQSTSTATAAASSNPGQPGGNTLTPAQILDRKISLSTDPVGVEVVLALIGEQANDKLPAGTKPLKFELNGTAFQLAGFTRNFQVRDYKVENQTVRQALTLLVQKANPTQNADLKTAEQQMIWVVIDGDNPDKATVSLTSREAATLAQQALPTEFAP